MTQVVRVRPYWTDGLREYPVDRAVQKGKSYEENRVRKDQILCVIKRDHA